jgi:PAS domain S-box-containing protein
LRVTAAREWVDREWVARLATNYSIEMASDVFCQILGVTQAQRKANAQIVAERIHPDDRPDFISQNVAAMNSLETFNWDGRILRNGQARWVHFNSVPRPLANGDVLWTGILQDTTESRRIEQKLQASEANLAALFNGSIEPIVLLDADGVVLNANDAMCRRMGIAAKNFMGHVIFSFLPHGLAKSRRAKFSKAMKTGTLQVFMDERNGRVMETHVCPIFGPTGQVTRVALFVHDITDRIRAETCLRKSRDELEVKVRERTARLQALALELTQAEHRERRRIAHILHEDLQQRLVGIQFKLHSLLDDGPEGSVSLIVNRTLKELTATIQLTREMATHIAPPVLSSLGLCAALDWLAQDVQAKCNLEVRIEGCRTFKLASDGLEQFAFDAIRELLLNICKHAAVKSAEVRVRPAGKRNIAITVLDKGKGGAEIHNNQSSFGLLSIRERACALGVGFDMESRPGKGTCVTLLLPTLQ